MKPETRWAIYISCGKHGWFLQRVFGSRRDAIKWHNEFWTNVPKQTWKRVRRRGLVKCVRVQIEPIDELPEWKG